jgi:hypothetical protein
VPFQGAAAILADDHVRVDVLLADDETRLRMSDHGT